MNPEGMSEEYGAVQLAEPTTLEREKRKPKIQVGVWLEPDLIELLDDLVRRGRFRSRSECAATLIKLGFKLFWHKEVN